MWINEPQKGQTLKTVSVDRAITPVTQSLPASGQELIENIFVKNIPISDHNAITINTNIFEDEV